MPARRKSPPGPFMEWHLPRQKRPWHRRSVSRTGKGSSSSEVSLLEPARGLQRLFNYLHETSTTYTIAQRLTDDIPWLRNFRYVTAVPQPVEPFSRSR